MRANRDGGLALAGDLCGLLDGDDELFGVGLIIVFLRGVIVRMAYNLLEVGRGQPLGDGAGDVGHAGAVGGLAAVYADT